MELIFKDKETGIEEVVSNDSIYTFIRDNTDIENLREYLNEIYPDVDLGECGIHPYGDVILGLADTISYIADCKIPKLYDEMIHYTITQLYEDTADGETVTFNEYYEVRRTANEI